MSLLKQPKENCRNDEIKAWKGIATFLEAEADVCILNKSFLFGYHHYICLYTKLQLKPLRLEKYQTGAMFFPMLMWNAGIRKQIISERFVGQK